MKIVRTGPNEVTLSGGLSAESLSAQKLTLNGKALEIKQLSSIPAILERLAKLEAATTGVACMGGPKILFDKNII